ncbi:MAG: hypothetical protein QM781_12125 [Chitinophagaceae bacterium]
MNQPHLSDQTLQLLASQSVTLQPEEEAHLQSCAQCAAQLTAYTALFGELKQLPESYFSFNVEALVMEKIPVVKERSADKWWLWLPLLVILPAGALMGYIFRSQINELFSGLPGLEMALGITASVCLLMLGGYDLIRNYNHRLKNIENNFPSAT